MNLVMKPIQDQISHKGIWSTLSREQSMCKGPEALRVSLAYSQKGKTRVARTQRMRQLSIEDEVKEASSEVPWFLQQVMCLL
jgi:hypothetical protein